MPTSVVIAIWLTTFARTAVPTLDCASGEPPGITTLGVTERRLLGVKLTAAAANVGTAPPADTGNCPLDRLNGALPEVANVTPRRGDASAGPARVASRKTAGSRCSPTLDATGMSP